MIQWAYERFGPDFGLIFGCQKHWSWAPRPSVSRWLSGLEISPTLMAYLFHTKTVLGGFKKGRVNSSNELVRSNEKCFPIVYQGDNEIEL